MKMTGRVALRSLWLLSVLVCSASDQKGAQWRDHGNLLEAGQLEGPKAAAHRFVSHNNTFVTAQVGASVVLHCKTSSATGGLVSWVRKRDYQLLTVGLHTHSSDDRFSINYVHWDWQLHVRFVQPRDAGVYECQVSSHPPTSLFVHLRVVVSVALNVFFFFFRSWPTIVTPLSLSLSLFFSLSPPEAQAEILGAPEKHVKVGSILRLVCIMHHTTEAMSYVFWYRGTEMVNYESEDADGGVVVESDDHTSVLMVTSAGRIHSGNYTCAPSNTRPASILVHVLNGEHPAAMQHGESSCRRRDPPSLTSLAALALLLQVAAALTGPWWTPPLEVLDSRAVLSQGRLPRRTPKEEQKGNLQLLFLLPPETTPTAVTPSVAGWLGQVEFEGHF